jgi:hypothetical protein
MSDRFELKERGEVWDPTGDDDGQSRWGERDCQFDDGDDDYAAGSSPVIFLALCKMWRMMTTISIVRLLLLLRAMTYVKKICWMNHITRAIITPPFPSNLKTTCFIDIELAVRRHRFW